MPTDSWDAIRFSKIYFCSAFMRDLTASKGWPVSHADVIHCGIETAAFPVKQDHSRFEKLLWVGRLAEDKDPLTAVRALAAARRKGLTQLTLDLYGHGDPDYIAMLDAEISSLGLTDCVFRKSAPAAEMRKLYSQYDALLFTSNWGEPFALTPLEAMSSGLPVITSLDGGQPELARHEVNCLIAEAANPELYATRIAELAASPQLREVHRRHRPRRSPHALRYRSHHPPDRSVPSQGTQVMSILFYDDSPVFGGHEVMSLLGLEAVLAEFSGPVHFIASSANEKLCEKVAAIAKNHPQLTLEKVGWHSSKFEALRNRLLPSRIGNLADRFRQLNPSLVVAIQGNIEHSSLGLHAARRAGIRCVSYIPVPHSNAEMGARLGAIAGSLLRSSFQTPGRLHHHHR